MATTRLPITYKELHHNCGCVRHKCTCVGKPQLSGCDISGSNCRGCDYKHFLVPCNAHRGVTGSAITDRHVTKVLLF
jgi:hypothetical protein